MKPVQARRLFRETSTTLGLTATTTAAEEALGSLTNLTPADFTLVAEQSRFQKCNTQADLLARLQVECGSKPGGWRKPIGF